MTNRTATNPIAEALQNVLVSPNVSDSNGEAANLVDVLGNLASAVWFAHGWRTDPSRRPNAIEGHGEAIKEAARSIESGLESVATAIDGLAIAILDRRGPT
jgi:hypothetical protein